MPLHASVSDDGKEGWREFARRNGVSVTGLLEVIGIWLAEHNGTTPLDGQWAVWVEEARAVDAERRSREPGA